VSREKARLHLDCTMTLRLAALCLCAAACSPILTPVTPKQATPLTAQTRPPAVLWLVDTSGSLLVPVNPSSSACPAGCGPTSACPAACETRQAQLVAGLGTLSAGLPQNTKHSLVAYPTDAMCGAPSRLDVSDEASAARIIDQVRLRQPIGGTPTAAALNFVAGLPVQARDTFVVLATDGLPNCNANNPNNTCTATDPQSLAACRCTTTSCATALCALGCLDDLNTVNASHALAARGLQLMVLGVGSEVSSATASFSAMEMALPRTCTQGTDCASGTCSANGQCAERLYVTTSTADYALPAARLAQAVARAARCDWWLSQEVTQAGLRVELAGEVTTDWSLSTIGGEPRLVFGEVACAALQADAARTPVFSVLAP
jgi:hypothetical protein